ncbi:hypothetical protein B1no1_26720 [Thermolongibacillus altinsuensis]|jgi:hypothetical protein|nr:hypothetical protein B1no1_26720 [Thermolongibacillus altinsuensis]
MQDYCITKMIRLENAMVSILWKRIHILIKQILSVSMREENEHTY